MDHKQVFAELDDALKLYGTYNYYDKGVDEVFDSSEIASFVRTFPSGKEAGKWMKGLATHEHGQHLIDHLANCLDDTDDKWFEEMVEESGANY
jgi:hypothetical protein